MSMHLQTPLKAAFGLSTPESMTSRIERATLERAPFPHLTVPEVLPAFTLADVRSYWPDETAFSTYGDGYDRKLGDAGRFGLYVLGSAAADRCAGLDRDTREFWREFAAGPARQAMMALYRRYLPGLRARFGSLLPELELETFGVLVNCYKGIAVGVHTDHPSFLCTGTIYLNNGAGADAGTSLYTANEDGLRHDGLSYLAREDFTLSKTLPFADNTLVSLLRTANSFHGVEENPVPGPESRSTINLHIRLTDRCIASLYGDDVAMLFRERISGHCPWLVDGLDAWRAADWDSPVSATDEEMRPLLQSFRYGDAPL